MLGCRTTKDPLFVKNKSRLTENSLVDKNNLRAESTSPPPTTGGGCTNRL